jgi:hypothetical protein
VHKVITAERTTRKIARRLRSTTNGVLLAKSFLGNPSVVQIVEGHWYTEKEELPVRCADSPMCHQSPLGEAADDVDYQPGKRQRRPHPISNCIFAFVMLEM